MKKFTELNSYKHPGKYFNNPTIDDWLYINDIITDNISETLQKDFESTMWNDILGPIYENIQEDIYENIVNSYNSKDLLYKLKDKYYDYIVKPRFVETVKINKNSFTIEVSDKDIINEDEFKSLLNFYNYYVGYCEKRNNNYEVYIEPYKPQEETDYIYNDCKGIVYRLVDDNGLKRIKRHGLVPRHDINRYYPKYIYVFTDINDTDKVKHDIKKQGNLHLIKIDLNKYSNKLRFYIDPATINYKAFVTREYIPKYCCEEIYE